VILFELNSAGIAVLEFKLMHHGHSHGPNSAWA
jgi:hypothetical protein